MSRFPVLLTFPPFNLLHSRPYYSLLKSCNRKLYSLSFNTYYFTPFFSTSPLSATQDDAGFSVDPGYSKRSRKLRNETPEFILKRKLDLCSKHNNLQDALHLYKSARIDGIPLSVHHYNSLLYLCSLSATADNDCLDKGFEIFKQMGIDKVAPNEATFTNMARLGAAKNDPERAFQLVKRMKESGISPKLRSYGPALFGFCDNGDADGAYRVDAHMLECGVVPEEPELAALFKVSVDARRGCKVYEMLHRLRASVRQVSEGTARIVQDWFLCEAASAVGVDNWDAGKVKEGVIKGGGGWHGQGWLGTGPWRVVKAEMDQKGVCNSCSQRLVCIDIDPKETEDFASSLSSLACQKELRANFLQFQEWLKTHGPFDAVVDGANVGMINTHSFDFRQLYEVVNQLQQISPSKKLPLVILHRSRLHGGPAQNPNMKRMLESWRKAGALYSTPQGSYDDWYWLYAAVSCKCLLVTNDEMRDHLFQLLGNSIFPRWKEKHQVRISVSRSGLTLHMPPPYSNVIQESERGSWHIPTVIGDDLETPRQWLCATRVANTQSKIRVKSSLHSSNLRGK